MDEPTAPLTDDEVIVLGKIIKELKTSGITIIYISHRLDEIFDIADRVAVLRDGSLVSINNICNVNKENLIFDMVGRKLTETFPQRNLHYGRTMLEIKELSGQHNSPISFSVRQGEILGLGGLVGAGRTELTRLIFGADSKITGQIFIDGKEVEIKKPEDAVALGIGLVPEDRKNLGVLLRLSVNDNISLPILRKISNNGIVDLKKEETIVEKQIRELSIKTPSKRQKVINLSGGNQQKVALAKWLASDAKILILDEPTRGIDVGNKYEIYKLINQLAEKGMAIVVVSSDMQEIIGITDKLLILYEGKLMTELQKRNYSQEKILFYASGEKNQKGKCK
jgi:ribose transport system ATP-binding protein